MSTLAAAPAAVLQAADLRFGQVGIASVRVRDADPEALRAALAVRVREAPALFERAPVVADFSGLASTPDDAAATALLDAIRAAGMLPVGLAWGDNDNEARARRLGLPLIAKFRAAYERAQQQTADPKGAGEEPAAPPAVTPSPLTATVQHLQPVRTGQQVYAQGADLVVVGTVANGAEVLADGNVHIYGALRGRAFAGASGDKAARIFCSEFRAEIVSIAGHYRVLEELPDTLAGHAVQVWLDHDKLQIAAL